MGILDFIFGNKKETKITAIQSSSSQPTISSDSATYKDIQMDFSPFEFKSNQHQRYVNGMPVQGLQECPRIVKVEKNINGCKGYLLKNGDGYIVRMINGDTGQSQMSAKPMRIVKTTKSEVLLKGYKVSAQSPFGFQNVDLSDYGLTVSLKNDQVVKCILHMYDRNIDIEYRFETNIANSTVDRFSKMVEQATFNPFKITVNPSLQNASHLPNYTDVFRSEIQTTIDRAHSIGMPVDKDLEMLRGYIFNLVESYYNNAGYVPKNSLDEIIEQSHKAAKQTTYASSFPSLDELKYQMYYVF